MDPNTTDPNKLFSVKDMVVVITGGATGIGLMMTKAFADNGAAKVYIIGRRAEVLEEAAKKTSRNGNVVPIVGDVGSKESLAKVAEQIKNEVGYVNLLCCNAGNMVPRISIPTGASIQEFAAKCLEQDPNAWNGSFAINTTGVAFTIFSFLELLSAGNTANNCPGRHSQVLVTSSIAGYLRNPSAFGSYPLTKAATTHLVKCMSNFLLPHRIRVNGLAPGLYMSELAEPLIKALGAAEGTDPAVQGSINNDIIPAERIGSASDMAGMVLFMASAAGAYLNGNITVIDGGRLNKFCCTY